VRQVKARRFFRILADLNYGYLTRKYEQRTPREEELESVRHTYHAGIGEAWNTYTKNNELVKKAEKVRDLTIHEVFEQDEASPEEESARTRSLLVKAIRKAYDEFAEAVNDIWKGFTKDMERL
jgi:5-methylthioribose kinase